MTAFACMVFVRFFSVWQNIRFFLLWKLTHSASLNFKLKWFAVLFVLGAAFFISRGVCRCSECGEDIRASSPEQSWSKTTMWTPHSRFLTGQFTIDLISEPMYLCVFRLMEKEGMLKIIRNTQYYIKPTFQRKHVSMDASRAILREDLNRKMRFLSRTNRHDAYPGQITT